MDLRNKTPIKRYYNINRNHFYTSINKTKTMLVYTSYHRVKSDNKINHTFISIYSISEQQYKKITIDES